MNMNDPRTNPEAEGGGADPRLPAEVVAALRQDEARWTLDVPAEREARLLAACRAELAERLTADRHVDPVKASPAASSRIVPFPREWMRWAAAAAVVTILGILLFRQRPQPGIHAINLDQPTIVDALALARLVEAGVRDVQFDLDGDGVVGATDVGLLAQRAVQLPEGGAL